MRPRVNAVGFVALAAVALVGCPGLGGSVECVDTKTCIGPDASDVTDAGAESSVDAAGDARDATLPPGCEKTPSEDASAVVIDKCGVFVSPAGDDANDGTKAAPVKTIGKALSKTAGTVRRIYVCGGTTQTYEGTLLLTSSDASRGIFGGLSCDTWTYDATLRPVVRAPAANTIALGIDGAINVVIEDLAFAALDATGDGASSIAAFVRNDSVVTLRRVKLTAGKGTPSPKAASGNYSFPNFAYDGIAASGTVGGSSKEGPQCPAGGTMSKGGRGQEANGGGSSGAGLPTINPASPVGATGAGGAIGACGSGGLGKDGSNGPGGTPGNKPTTFGVIDDNGWQPAPGTDGLAGGVAQGGGGGGGPTTGAGGGGGVGGCGGAGGKGGAGGGGSIGLLILESAVAIDDLNVTTADGGKGGDGGGGQDGVNGGSGGGGASGGCGGGTGGKGGSGGEGGGGAGGVSVPVLYKSSKVPTVNKLATQKGSPGPGGAGGGGTLLGGANDDVKGL